MASSSVVSQQEEQDIIRSPNSFRNIQKHRFRASRTRSSNSNPPLPEALPPETEEAKLSGSLPEKSPMSGDCWKNSPRDKKQTAAKQNPPVGGATSFPSVRNKLRDRRRLREKRRSPAGANYIPSTEGTSTGDEECEVFTSKEVKSPTFQIGPDAHKQALHHQHFHNHANAGLRNQNDHMPVNRRLSPGTGLGSRFRGSKSQSDLDADCEDNTADYDSASMISASETAAGQSQFFIPDPSVADRDFQAHVQEIRVAGMQQLTASGGPQSEDDQATGTSSDDMEEDLGKILEKERREKSTLLQQLGQQEDRIVHLEKMVNELTRRLQDTCLENQNLRAENASLQKK